VFILSAARRKIVFLSQSLDSGGAERVLCTVMKALDPASFDIHLVLVSKIGAYANLIPEHVNTLVLGISNTRKALIAAIRALRRIRPDIIYATASRTAVLALLAGFFCNPYKLIVRYTSMPALDIRERYLRGWRLWLIRKLYRYADAMIAQTEEMGEELIKYFKIPRGRVHVITNPVDTDYIERSLRTTKSPFPSGSINVVASGSLCPIKGFDVLLDAFEIVAKRDGCFHLHILGSDPEGNRAGLEQRASGLGISDHLHFHGFKENPYPYYKFCDLFVLSSRREAMPNVLLECLYLGKAVVATRCAPVIERLVHEGRNGFLVDVENPEQMARAILGYRQLQGYSAVSSGNDIVSLFDRMAG